MTKIKYCLNCGNELSTNSKFCGKGGTPVNQEHEEATFSEKMKRSFDKLQTDEVFELKLESAEGLEDSRNELKKEAQKKLSG